MKEDNLSTILKDEMAGPKGVLYSECSTVLLLNFKLSVEHLNVDSTAVIRVPQYNRTPSPGLNRSYTVLYF